MAERFPLGESIWPSISNEGGSADDKLQRDIRQTVTEFSDYIGRALEQEGLSRFAFPLFRPFNAVFGLTRAALLCVITPLQGGLAFLRYMDWREALPVSLEAAAEHARRELGWASTMSFSIPADLVGKTSEERAQALEELSRRLAEQIKHQLERQQHKVQVKPIFRKPLDEMQVDESLCFVLMPFTPQFSRIYDDVITPAVAGAKLRALRADQIFSPTPIVEDIWVHIASARLIIADVSGKNANVFYELGIAHTLGKPVVIITQTKEDIPFDIGYIRYLYYSDDPTGWKKLGADLDATLSSLLG